MMPSARPRRSLPHAMSNARTNTGHRSSHMTAGATR